MKLLVYYAADYWSIFVKVLNDKGRKDGHWTSHGVYYPTPMTEMVIDATTGYGPLSFIDEFSRYNQIKMNENMPTIQPSEYQEGITITQQFPLA